MLWEYRPPYKSPGMPKCYASDLHVPRSHKEAMRCEHALFWGYSTGREVYGLLDAGTLGPV